MPLQALFNAAAATPSTAPPANYDKLGARLRDVFVRTWHLGFTSFGGPPVHFQILHRKFVDGAGKPAWIDEQTYQELFAICQALPGPGSTKMVFCITLLHAGFLPALFVFLVWSLPGAVGMYALALGIQNIDETLPAPAYALLSGLNAATVGIIALAAVQLARKAITDPLTRILVTLSGCAGLCYNALWFFPAIMVLGGAAAWGWDCVLRAPVGRWRAARARRHANPAREAEESEAVPIGAVDPASAATSRRSAGSAAAMVPAAPAAPVHEKPPHTLPVKWGLVIIAAFFASFIALMVTRGVLQNSPLALRLFQNMYLAGTVIFGGGPVVIPLLREYVVEPGWVSPRNFLLGLALIQAFPGPNFNFAVYLGALALAHTGLPTVVGAVLGFVGIFVPGLTLAVGFQALWRALRTRPSVVSILRGVNAAAVGLVFTAVYRLWEIGFLTPEESRGMSLGREPWWVVVAAATFVGCEWFKVPPAVAIVGGGVLGLCWYGAVVA
ncbi:chromate transporter-domain-containing protein [Geopyxis carbonaria]|nr:chromate transporter-domain-containing protein [Geopyxis carbonaria]